MALIVQKFGGSSVKDRNRIFNVARIVANTHKAGNDVMFDEALCEQGRNFGNKIWNAYRLVNGCPESKIVTHPP